MNASRKHWERDWHGRILLEHLTGKKFGFWTVVQFDRNYPTPKGYKNFKWFCVCDCGTGRSVSSNSLKKGKSISCGCGIGRITSTTHGLTRTYIHRKWDGMKSRCFNPNNKDYKRYGARGISVCEGILKSPQVLLDIIGPRPNKKLSIDRRNNNGNYSCGRCKECHRNNWPMNLRWATASQQQNNRRNNRKAAAWV